MHATTHLRQKLDRPPPAATLQTGAHQSIAGRLLHEQWQICSRSQCFLENKCRIDRDRKYALMTLCGSSQHEKHGCTKAGTKAHKSRHIMHAYVLFYRCSIICVWRVVIKTSTLNQTMGTGGRDANREPRFERGYAYRVMGA